MNKSYSTDSFNHIETSKSFTSMMIGVVVLGVSVAVVGASFYFLGSYIVKHI